MIAPGVPGFEAAVAVYTLPGQRESGDRHVLVPNAAGLLIAVVDGLGHGRDAAVAAQRAVDVIGSHAVEDSSLTSLVWRCHEELRGTRGVVMSMAALNFRRRLMTWLGIGNVEGRLVKRAPEITQKEEGLLLRQGVVGGSLPQLQTAVVPFAYGDLLLFATDGIDPGFVEHVDPGDGVQAIADEIVARHGRRNDDALVLVLRCLS